MSEMMERVDAAMTAALNELRDNCPPGCDVSPKATTRILARAAVEAMRTATPEMIAATAPANPGEELVFKVAYSRAIDAALA